MSVGNESVKVPPYCGLSEVVVVWGGAVVVVDAVVVVCDGFWDVVVVWAGDEHDIASSRIAPIALRSTLTFLFLNLPSLHIVVSWNGRDSYVVTLSHLPKTHICSYPAS